MRPAHVSAACGANVDDGLFSPCHDGQLPSALLAVLVPDLGGHDTVLLFDLHHFRSYVVVPTSLVRAQRHDPCGD